MGDSPSRSAAGVVYSPSQAAEIVAELEAREVDAELVACASEDSLREVLGGADFLVAEPFSPALFQAAPRVRWLQSLSAGVECWLTPPGPPSWPITRMTGVYEYYIAEYVFAHLMYMTHQVGFLKEAQSRREWIPRSDWRRVRTRRMRGRLIGVAGLGHVGRQVASLGEAFDMEVRGLRRAPDEDVLTPAGSMRVFGMKELTQFLTGLDVLVLALPLTRATEGLIGARELALLKKSAIVINVARGAIIANPALQEALQADQLGGAILDTFVSEPLPAESPLWAMPNVTITPHLAGEAPASEVAEVCTRNIRSFLHGDIPGVVVDVRRGY